MIHSLRRLGKPGYAALVCSMASQRQKFASNVPEFASNEPAAQFWTIARAPGRIFRRSLRRAFGGEIVLTIGVDPGL
jgi:hypothetical protein